MNRTLYNITVTVLVAIMFVVIIVQPIVKLVTPVSQSLVLPK